MTQRILVAGVARRRQSRDGVGVLVVGDRGDAAGGRCLGGRQHPAVGDVGRRRGQGGGERHALVLDEHAGRVVDVDEPHGRRAEPQRVQVVAEQGDRLVGQRAVQQRLVWTVRPQRARGSWRPATARRAWRRPRRSARPRAPPNVAAASDTRCRELAHCNRCACASTSPGSSVPPRPVDHLGAVGRQPDGLDGHHAVSLDAHVGTPPGEPDRHITQEQSHASHTARPSSVLCLPAGRAVQLGRSALGTVAAPRRPRRP